MKFRFSNVAIIAALLATSSTQATPVRFQGASEASGMRDLPDNARLADALLQARPRPDAYLLGASFERPQAMEEQVRLRAGLQYGAEQLAESSDVEIAALAQMLLDWLDARAATGRRPITGSARLIQAQPANNPVLAAGDTLRIPFQPRTITVMGAVGQACVLPHTPQRDARDYLRDCSPSKLADRNDIYLIQPDGRVQQLGIALWNRADPQAIAAGGTLFVPLRAQLIKRIDPLFNSDFAAFIATQPVNP